MTPATHAQAAAFFGTLWAALHLADATTPPIPAHRHHPAAYDPKWLATLPLPTRGQPVLLAAGSHVERHHHTAELHHAHSRHPRTRIHAGLHRTPSWITRTAEHLTRLTHSTPPVIATAYTSTTHDATLHPHRDAWDGIVIQLTGTKQWQLGPGLLHPHHPVEHVLTTPGDILIIPDGLPHHASTPPDPGHSLHLLFAIHRRTPAPNNPAPTNTPSA